MPSGFDNQPNTETVQYRGVKYVLRELPIGEYDDIAKAATETVTDASGIEVERPNERTQMRLMLAKCMIEPKGVDITAIPTRVVIALNGVVNKLHYGEPGKPEPDEMKKAIPKSGDSDAESGGEEKGKA